MKSDIITLLRQRQEYVSGQELCERFGVSRTAVWKAIEQLKKDGYVIDAVKNRGYLLREDASRVFGRTEIQSRIHTQWAGQTLDYHESVDSTNVQAKRLAEEGAPHGTLVVADQQTAGRGRRGRGWESPAGTNLYFTLLLRPEIPADKASMLTLVMAIAVAQGISRCCPLKRMGEEGAISRGAETSCTNISCTKDSQESGRALQGQVGIKWPNDIVIDGRKVCGILTEMSLSVEQGSIQYVVIGAGINVGRQTFTEELQGKAIALEEVFGRVSRSSLLTAVMEAFEDHYRKFVEAGSLALLKEDYNALLVNCDKEVRVLDPKGEFSGIARGIRDTGELIVELPGGGQKEVYAGEVSVRGIYGYV